MAKVGKSGEKLGKVVKSWKKWRKVIISRKAGEKRGKVAKSWKKWIFFCKMAAGGHFGSPICAILDDRKSLSIAFLTISDQYATLFFFLNFFSKWPPAAILEVRFAPKTIGFFHYVLSMAMPNMKLIGEFVTQLEMPQAF